MKDLELIIIYSWRLISREWRRFVLPFLSLSITAIVLVLILLLTNASSLLLNDQARNLLGGDVVIESVNPINSASIWQELGITPEAESSQISFSATIQSGDVSIPVSFRVVDDNYPLYGELIIKDATYKPLPADEILLDQNAINRLGINSTGEITFGNQSYRLAGVIESEPNSLFSGFQFLPRVILSQAGFLRSGLDPELFRLEYEQAARIPNLTADQIAALRLLEETSNGLLDVDVASGNRGGLARGLGTVSDFLIVSVLITAVLAAVNVYSSTLYLVTIERKSLAVLLALGLTRLKLVYVLGAALTYSVLLAGVVGSLFGTALFRFISGYIAAKYNVVLPDPNWWLYSGLCILLLLVIAIAAFLPAIRQMISLNPRQILVGDRNVVASRLPLRSLILTTTATLLPLVFLAAFLLSNILLAIGVMIIISLVYVAVAVIYTLCLRWIYRRRQGWPFILRSIVSQKQADGLFGIVSFASLFIALSAIFTLVLTEASLEKYLNEDLERTVPTTYVIDVQPSQVSSLNDNFPDLTLLPSIGARIVAIDDIYVQQELAAGNPDIDRELGREFNLTFRNELLTSEAVARGESWGGRSGDISVDEEFAKRANISLGSKLIFSIQGFIVEGVVSSLRSTDSRSGLPFFYFLMSPADIADFPAVYFGYSYFDADKQKELGNFVAREMPNVSVIETQAIGPIIIALVSTLLLLVLVVTIPPLAIATLLIATLVVSSYAERRREGGRLRALGLPKTQLMKHYLLETLSISILSGVVAYGLSILITYIMSYYYLRLETLVWFDSGIILSFGLVLVLVGAIGWYLFKTDTMPLRELLSYGDNT